MYIDQLNGGLVYLFNFFAGETNLGKKGHCEHRGCIGVTRPNAFIFLQKP